jgi:hypothetical protein
MLHKRTPKRLENEPFADAHALHVLHELRDLSVVPKMGVAAILVLAFVRACVRACACVHACVRACVRALAGGRDAEATARRDRGCWKDC